MSSDTDTQQTGKFTGFHLAMIMFAFFGVIISVNLTMATMAGRSWTGLVVNNSYVASQEFNEQLKDAKAQKAAGLYSSLKYEKGSLVFVLKDRTGTPLKAKHLVAEIGRPAFEQADQKLDFLPTQEKRYRLAVNLAEGTWAIKITGEAGNQSYRRDARIYVNANGEGTLQ